MPPLGKTLLPEPMLTVYRSYFFLALPLKSKIKYSFSKELFFSFKLSSRPNFPTIPVISIQELSTQVLAHVASSGASCKMSVFR